MTNAHPENTLRVRRAERRINQFDVAAALGVSRDRYWRIENGYAVPTAAERTTLAEFFGVPNEVLFPAPTETTAHPAA